MVNNLQENGFFEMNRMQDGPLKPWHYQSRTVEDSSQLITV